MCLLQGLEERNGGKKLLKGLPIEGKSLAHIGPPAKTCSWRNPAPVQADGRRPSIRDDWLLFVTLLLSGAGHR
jgi:hypothetical protein